jgi:hypothetical protein
MTATNDDDAGQREHRPDPREQLGDQAPEPQANDFFDW